MIVTRPLTGNDSEESTGSVRHRIPRSRRGRSEELEHELTEGGGDSSPQKTKQERNIDLVKVWGFRPDERRRCNRRRVEIGKHEEDEDHERPGRTHDDVPSRIPGC